MSPGQMACGLGLSLSLPSCVTLAKSLLGLRLIMGKMERIISTPLTSGGIQGKEGSEIALQGKGGEREVSSVRTGALKGGDGLRSRLAAQRPVSLPQAAGATALCSVSGRAARHPAQGAGPALPVPAGHAGEG